MEQSNFNTSFIPTDTLGELLQNLNLREREVLQRRYGLDPKACKKETLECIGKDFGVTRERIRQIENAAVKKLVQLPDMQIKLQGIDDIVYSLIEYYGGIMAQEHLVDELWGETVSAQDTSSFLFILDNLLERYKKIENEHVYPSWAHSDHDEKNTIEVIGHIIDLINTHSEPLSHTDLLQKFINKKEQHEVLSGFSEMGVASHLQLSKKIKKDVFGNWGLANWRIVSPKRMNDKIYLVLKKHKKPMHFTEIAFAIDEMNFDAKKAHPPTIHNELILDKDRFVLVGRGIYALAEQGYKHGVVADVISDIIKISGPLTKEEIVDAVLAQRVVAESTIYLALTSKDRFRRMNDGRYVIGE